MEGASRQRRLLGLKGPRYCEMSKNESQPVNQIKPTAVSGMVWEITCSRDVVVVPARAEDLLAACVE